MGKIRENRHEHSDSNHKGIIPKYCRVLLLATLLFSFCIPEGKDWGFFAHRRINRMAVFTLPPRMMPFYKRHIEYLTAHAVDADKRRYATRHEAVRHYIDLDHWGEFPFPELPRNWIDVLIRYTRLYQIDDDGDSCLLFEPRELYEAGRGDDSIVLRSTGLGIDPVHYRSFFIERIWPLYYEDSWRIACDSLLPDAFRAGKCKEIIGIDDFSEHGILPYHLLRVQRQLMRAFEEKNKLNQ